MTFRVATLGRGASIACEALGLLALALSPEVWKPTFLFPIALGFLAVFTSVRLRDRMLLLLVAFFVLAGYATAIGQPTGTVLTSALIPAHALLWLARSEIGYRFWRLGIALMELVLAAILSPEAHMFVLIFFFVALGSLALSLGFMEKVFLDREDEALHRPLRASYVGAVLLISLVIFLSSLLIFPLLPRAHWNGDSTASAGYNDVVNFRQGVLYWDQRESAPAVFVFRNTQQEWKDLLPYGLLRGEVLESFDGVEWRAGRRPKEPWPRPIPQGSPTIEVMRQPIDSETLMAPYGAEGLSAGNEIYVTRSSEGEWAGSGQRKHGITYKVAPGKVETLGLGEAPSHATQLFSRQAFPQIAALAERLGKGAASSDEKVERVRKFFSSGAFSVALDPVPPVEAGKPHPVEDFLFQKKRGHCELFAASAALLFRAMGIPARLVVGFRAHYPNRGNVLTVRSSDAHAWVEVWRGSRGWMPMDFTPMYANTSIWPEALSDSFNWISAYWHRYILEYEFDSAVVFQWVIRVAKALGAVVALFVFYRMIRILAARRPNEREKISRVYEDLADQLLHRAGLYPETAFRERSDARRWYQRYMELRFGAEPPTRRDTREMKKRARRLLKVASRELGTAP